MNNEIIKFENVSFGYNEDVNLLNNINLTVLKGEFFFLTGVSGSGKTSLIKLIYLEQMQKRGNIFIFGKNTRNAPKEDLRKKIGVVLQKPLLIEHLNILENTLLPFKIAGVDTAKNIQEAVELLNWVGLKNVLHKYPREISIGEQHRASIARAVIKKPSLILADEPTGNVDQETSNKINNLFLALNKLGTTVIFATHKMQDIQYLKMSYFNISNGKIEKIVPNVSR